MKRPFVDLMEMVASLDPNDQVTFGELSERWGEPVARIMDAVDADKMLEAAMTRMIQPSTLRAFRNAGVNN